MLTKSNAIANVKFYKQAQEHKVKNMVANYCENTVAPIIDTASRGGNTKCEVVITLPYRDEIKAYLESRGFSVEFGNTTLVVSWEE